MSGTRRKAGRLGPQVEGYRVWLVQHGYTTGTIVNMLKDLGQVGGFLSRGSRRRSSTRSWWWRSCPPDEPRGSAGFRVLARWCRY